VAFDPGGFSSEFGPGTAPPQPPPPPNFTSHGVLVGQGISPVTATPAGAANTFLAGAGAAADPVFRKLVGADLPNPAAAVLGGVQSKAVVANQFLTGISTAGVPSAAQPSTLNLSDRDAAPTTFVPTISVQTLGDGVFNVLAATGGYRRLGFLVWFYVNVRFSLTFTTAAGALSISGFPIAPYPGLAGYVPYAVSNLPASPADHLIGQFNNASLLALITGNAYANNYWGPTATNIYGFVSGTTYQVIAGGVYQAGAGLFGDLDIGDLLPGQGEP
jgi:hypothetical protein